MPFTTFKKFKKQSGTLLPISFKKQIPFKVKRIFIIYGNKKFTRGNHAHKKCSQFFIKKKSKIKLNFTTKKISSEIILDSSEKKGFLLKPISWCKLSFMTKNSLIMVFCDQEYNYKDYIVTYKEFLKYIK